MDEITVIGGGWSASRVDLTRARGYVIGVNEAALLAPRVDCIVSMDRLWVENRWSRFADLRTQAYLRKSALKNIQGWETRSWITAFDCDHKTTAPSEQPAQLNGDNSGSVAINLAYRWRPKRLWLLGIDFSRGPKGEPYWYPPYEWRPEGATKPGKYREWANNLHPLVGALAKSGCRTICVTTSKEMRMFERIPPETFNAMR